MMMIYTVKSVLLYTYDTIKHEDNIEPELVASLQVKDDIIFMQFPTADLIALFYATYFEIYSVSDSYLVQKKLEKKYNMGPHFKIFSVPEAVDQNLNIFF
jgi:hypothetical protein